MKFRNGWKEKPDKEGFWIYYERHNISHLEYHRYMSICYYNGRDCLFFDDYSNNESLSEFKLTYSCYRFFDFKDGIRFDENLYWYPSPGLQPGYYFTFTSREGSFSTKSRTRTSIAYIHSNLRIESFQNGKIKPYNNYNEIKNIDFAKMCSLYRIADRNPPSIIPEWGNSFHSIIYNLKRLFNKDI